MTKSAKLLSLILCLTLSLGILAACGKEEEKGTDGIWANAKYTEDATVGEGAKTVKLKIEAEGKSITLTVKTDADILGDALVSYGIVEGDDSEFGLYIKKVNGISADFDTDGYYWGFYQKGEYMMSGVDSTEIKGGEEFELVRTKG